MRDFALAKGLEAEAAQTAVMKHLKKLKGSTNVTQFTAQLFEEQMVLMLKQFALDPEIPVTIRRQCALDVLTLARGQPRPWLVDPNTINPQALGGAGFGATVGQEIEAAKFTTDLHQQLADYTARNVHPRNWPAEVRAIATDMVAYYEDQPEGEVEVIPP
jgi:hypothetical protein